MEEQINKEIMDYKETIAGGLTLRQFIWAILAIAATVVTFLKLSPRIGSDMASWVCIFTALPCVCLGFVTWHGMTADRILVVLIQHVLTPQCLKWQSKNAFSVLVQRTPIKEGKNSETENTQHD